jgi:hypothetical protein
MPADHSTKRASFARRLRADGRVLTALPASAGRCNSALPLRVAHATTGANRPTACSSTTTTAGGRPWNPVNRSCTTVDGVSLRLKIRRLRFGVGKHDH